MTAKDWMISCLAVSLGDEALDASTCLRVDFVTAFKAKNLSSAELALQALTATTRQEKQLVDEINNYCQEEQKPTQSLTSSTRLKGTLSIDKKK